VNNAIYQAIFCCYYRMDICANNDCFVYVFFLNLINQVVDKNRAEDAYGKNFKETIVFFKIFI
jgi:hypothetical protein